MSRGRDSRGDNLAVYSDSSKHCFSCAYHEFPKHYIKPDESLRTNVKKNCPSDFSRDIPTYAWKWLLQYGLGYRYWESRCGYSEKDQRLIFLVGEPTDFSIGRYLPDTRVQGEGTGGSLQQRGGVPVDGIKKPPKWFCYGDAHKAAHIIGDIETENSIVLVEDIISAHKVGQLNPTIPLFGTNIFPSVVSVLRLYKKPVVMWLDSDQKDHAIKRAAHLQMLIGAPVSYVFTTKDPKELSTKTIAETINQT